MVLPYQRHHQKLRQLENQTQNQLLQSSLDILQGGKPFWIWSREEHLRQAIATDQQCCFNHIVEMFCTKEGRRVSNV